MYYDFHSLNTHMYVCTYTYYSECVSQLLQKIMAVKISWILVAIDFVWNDEMISAGGCPTLYIH